MFNIVYDEFFYRDGEHMKIDIEQCRENDMIKDVISKSSLPIKYIKLLLRISDAIYLNSINYNVSIDNNVVKILLISSKPENQTGIFNTTSLTNILYRIKDMERENNDVQTKCISTDDMLQVNVEIMF